MVISSCTPEGESHYCALCDEVHIVDPSDFWHAAGLRDVPCPGCGQLLVLLAAGRSAEEQWLKAKRDAVLLYAELSAERERIRATSGRETSSLPEKKDLTLEEMTIDVFVKDQDSRRRRRRRRRRGR